MIATLSVPQVPLRCVCYYLLGNFFLEMIATLSVPQVPLRCVCYYLLKHFMLFAADFHSVRLMC